MAALTTSISDLLTSRSSGHSHKGTAMTVSHRHTRPRRCAWPSQVDLPQGQTSMSDADWIQYIETCLRSADALSGIDRALFASARRSLLALRRHHLASAGMQPPRWVATREGSVRHG